MIYTYFDTYIHTISHYCSTNNTSMNHHVSRIFEFTIYNTILKIIFISFNFCVVFFFFNKISTKIYMVLHHNTFLLQFKFILKWIQINFCAKMSAYYYAFYNYTYLLYTFIKFFIILFGDKFFTDILSGVYIRINFRTQFFWNLWLEHYSFKIIHIF